MFVLRSIDKTHRESNISLGETYTFISREKSPQEFGYINNQNQLREDETRITLDVINQIKSPYKIYGYILYMKDNGEGIFPLRENSLNFIVMSNGNTYDNITYKSKDNESFPANTTTLSDGTK